MNHEGSWAMDEFGGAKMGDARLCKRLIKLADRLGKPLLRAFLGRVTVAQKRRQPIDSSIRRARKNVDWTGKPCWLRTMVRTEARIAAHPVVLCLQDTTELDFNGQVIDGLGHLSYPAQRGMYVHPTYAVTPQRLPLGILDTWMWARPLDITESRRWIEGYERIAGRALQLPTTRLVYVADREADILELMQRAHALGYPADYLLRAQHNRCLPEGGKTVVCNAGGSALGRN